ncbi:MAG: HAD family phosphatase [Candidatus Levybacteria bacterium]|nr:HAD family phosphatase [Candidatus Levybacteria bacterium]
MIKAVIFDLDGVISDTQSLHDEANSEILKSYGIKISSEAITKKWAGVPQRKLFETIFKENNVNPDIDKAIFDKWALVIKRINQVKQIPGAIKFVQKLQEENFSLAVASSATADFINRVLNVLKIKSYFTAIVNADEVKNGKPAPDIFQKTAEKLNINPSDCLVIEDAPTGVQAAKSAGMICIAITSTHKKEELIGADKIINSFSEVKVNDIIKI